MGESKFTFPFLCMSACSDLVRKDYTLSKRFFTSLKLLNLGMPVNIDKLSYRNFG